MKKPRATYKMTLLVSGQQSAIFSPSWTDTTTEPSPLNGSPSHTTKSPLYLCESSPPLAVLFDPMPKIASILVDTRAIASLSLSPANLPAHRASCARPWTLESLLTPKPSSTPASVKIFAGLSVNGGPVRTSFFSQLVGAPRLPVRITGMFASARCLATYRDEAWLLFICVIGTMEPYRDCAMAAIDNKLDWREITLNQNQLRNVILNKRVRYALLCFSLVRGSSKYLVICSNDYGDWAIGSLHIYAGTSLSTFLTRL